ncbi:VC0807 family protein [Kribbella sp. VKM Ac-2569]|uniref:VC0807 family protein n=1 Tax=Kribbella sp. VKM Ac-2569 TaxID=2512220 RepID=UPI00102BE053|nr:VC0807 family protein [Kribbella sp. VKM Ac-2569]
MSSTHKGPWLLVVDVGVPLALFYGLRALGASDLTALLVGIVPGLISSAVSLVRTRRTDLIGMAVVLSMLGSAAVAVLGGDARVLLVRNAWISLPFAGITLWSLRHPQPLCYTVTLAMMPRRARVMEQLWATNARFRHAWKWITVFWGIATIIDGVVRIVLAYTLPISVVPATDPVITVLTIVVLQIPTIVLLRRSGTWHLVFAPRRPTVGEMTDDKLSQARMRELLDSGEATPMLAGMEVGPTWYADRWWYIPAEAADDADYQPADPEKSERFDRLRRRAEAVDRVQAELDGRQ